MCTLLFNVDSTDLTGPLTIFQNTKFEKADFKKLVKTINAAGGESKLEDVVVDGVFEMWWPKLQEEISRILEAHTGARSPKHRSERAILEEILELTRLNAREERDVERSISPAAIRDLSMLLAELKIAFVDNDQKRLENLFDQLNHIIIYMCDELNLPKSFLTDRAISRRRGLLGTEEDESKEL